MLINPEQGTTHQNGRICGSTSPVITNTSSNLLYMNFVSNGDGNQGDRFEHILDTTFYLILIRIDGKNTLQIFYIYRIWIRAWLPRARFWMWRPCVSTRLVRSQHGNSYNFPKSSKYASPAFRVYLDNLGSCWKGGTIW